MDCLQGQSQYEGGVVTWRDRRRKWVDLLAKILIFILCMCAVAPFVLITAYVISKGFSSLDLDFFTSLPKGPGEVGGGVANAIVGSLIMLAMASLLGVSWGVAAGVYLGEYGTGKTAQCLRFAVDLMTSIPSIVIGIFVYALVVVRFGFSAYAGSLALALIMIPIVARSTEEMLKLIPQHVREAGLALGIPRWKVILRIILPGARSALLTGIMLAVARVAGETAPLLFTALGNQYFSQSLNQPTASLPVQIYNMAKSGFVDWERQAWAGALLLVALVMVINLSARLFLSPRRGDVR